MEFTKELSDLVVMKSKWTMSRIFRKNKLATGFSVAKTLIEYNSNCSEENEEERMPIYIELTEQKKVLKMIKMLLTLEDQMYKKRLGRYYFG